MARQKRTAHAGASRGVIAEIDRRLDQVERQLEGHRVFRARPPAQGACGDHRRAKCRTDLPGRRCHLPRRSPWLAPRRDRRALRGALGLGLGTPLQGQERALREPARRLAFARTEDAAMSTSRRCPAGTRLVGEGCMPSLLGAHFCDRSGSLRRRAVKRWASPAFGAADAAALDCPAPAADWHSGRQDGTCRPSRPLPRIGGW